MAGEQAGNSGVDRDRRDQYWSVSAQGFSRVVCDTHYTNDMIASQIIGTTAAELLLNNVAFKPKFDAARAELEKAGLAAK